VTERRETMRRESTRDEGTLHPVLPLIRDDIEGDERRSERRERTLKAKEDNLKQAFK
jgi:hypothetical protein